MIFIARQIKDWIELKIENSWNKIILLVSQSNNLPLIMFTFAALKLGKTATTQFYSLRKFHILQYDNLASEVLKFDSSANIRSAVTPPTTWFHDPIFHKFDQVKNSNF